MGRIKTQLIKRITLDLHSKHKEEFKKTFEENKPIVEKFTEMHSKKLRNIIAGYVTRLMRTKEE